MAEGWVSPRPARDQPPGAVPIPSERFRAEGLLFEDVVSEAHQARGLSSGARVGLRLFKPGFDSAEFVRLVEELISLGPASASPPPEILCRYFAGRARPTPVESGLELEVDPDLASTGCLCLVEELAGNQTLMAAIRSGRMLGKEQRIVAITEQVLSGLAFAHDHRCVHGNLTPYCVFLGPEDTVKLEGLGLHTEVEELRMQTGGDALSASTMEPFGPGGAPPEIQFAVKLRCLLDLSANLSKTLQLKQLMPKIADILFQLFHQAERCFIIQAEDGEPPRLLPLVIKTLRPQDEANAPFNGSIVRQCLEKATAFLSDDAQKDERVQLSQSVVFKVRSVMCVPLCNAEGKAFGVIQLDTQDRSKKFTQDDLELLWGVANQASIALENARLLEEAVHQEKRNRDLELAHQVQLSFLPRSLPELAGYSFGAHYQPALDVAGDYYDFTPLPDGRLAAVVGVAAGNGVPAAFMMA
jgi:hypothetical protein